MRLFNPSELQSKPFNELTAGQCFYDTAQGAWVAIFAMAASEPTPQRFVVPLAGALRLVASPLSPEPEYNGVRRVLTFNLKDSFDIRLDSEPFDDMQPRTNAAKPLLIMRDGPTIHTELMRNLAIPSQRNGCLLNLVTFHCDFASEHPMEIHGATSVEGWSLVFNAKPNLGRVFFQQPSPSSVRKEKPA